MSRVPVRSKRLFPFSNGFCPARSSSKVIESNFSMAFVGEDTPINHILALSISCPLQIVQGGSPSKVSPTHSSDIQIEVSELREVGVLAHASTKSAQCGLLGTN